jgi:hypothetical protein
MKKTFFQKLFMINPGLTVKEAEEKGYHVACLELFSGHRFAWTKDFEVGDEVYWLGHDGVGGWWYGDKHIADAELIHKNRLGGNIPFYKKVSWINNK